MALSPLVIFETVFTLQRSYGLSRADIREKIEDLISLRAVRLPDKQLYYRALELYVSTNPSFADAYNAAYMASRGLTEIYSFDTDFDRLPGVTRLEPAVGG